MKSINSHDAVVHLAASLGVRNTEENSYRCYQINVRGTENILDICLQKKIPISPLDFSKIDFEVWSFEQKF